MLKEFNGMQIDKVNWLTAGFQPGLIGMIQITNAEGVKKVYVGAIRSGESTDEDSDIKMILLNGAKMHPETAENLHNHLKGD